MEKKSFDYSQLNPKAILGTPDGKELRSLRLNIFEKDGSPARLKAPTAESANHNLQLILKAVPEDVDPRELVEALYAAGQMISEAIGNTLISVDVLGHRIDETDEYDICMDKVHDAIEAYQNPELSDEVTGENSNEVLDRFFVGNKKPN